VHAAMLGPPEEDVGAITLQFVTCSDPASWSIRTFQRGCCSHVDAVMDDGGLLGARLDGGGQIRPPNYEKFSRVERVVIAVPYYKERAYWNFLKAQVGKPYDKLAIVAFAINRTTGARRMRGSATSWLRPDSNMPRLCAILRRASIGSTCATCIWS
jgi:hypothetical protein